MANWKLNSSGARLRNGATHNGLGTPTSIMEIKAAPQEACPKANLMLMLSPPANSRLHQVDKANYHRWGGIKYTKIAYIKFIFPLNILNIIFIKIIIDYKSILWGRIFQQPRKPYKSRNKKNWPRYTSENYQLRKEKILTFLWCSLPSIYTPGIYSKRDLKILKTGLLNFSRDTVLCFFSFPSSPFLPPFQSSLSLSYLGWWWLVPGTRAC